MNNTFEYKERGVKIIRRDYDTQKSLTEKSLLNFVNDMIKKGMISSKILVQLIKENYKDSLIETKDIINESYTETKDIIDESINEMR